MSRTPFWSQPEAAVRLRLTRVVCAAALVREVWEAPDPGRLAAIRGAVAPAHANRDVRLDVEHRLLRACILPLAGYWSSGRGLAGALSGLAANIAGLRIARIVDQSVPGTPSNPRHLHEIGFLLVGAQLLARTVRTSGAERRAIDRTALGIAQLLVAGVYTQAAVAKVRQGHTGWVSSSSTPRAALALSGTVLGRRLSRSTLLPSRVGVLLVAFEAMMTPLTLIGAWPRRLVGLACLAFHATTYATLRISFWHLAWLHVPLLALPDGLLRRLRRARGAPSLSPRAGAGAC